MSSDIEVLSSSSDSCDSRDYCYLSPQGSTSSSEIEFENAAIVISSGEEKSDVKNEENYDAEVPENLNIEEVIVTGRLNSVSLIPSINQVENELTPLEGSTLAESIKEVEDDLTPLESPTLAASIKQMEDDLTQLGSPTLDESIKQVEDDLTPLGSPILTTSINHLAEKKYHLKKKYQLFGKAYNFRKKMVAKYVKLCSARNVKAKLRRVKMLQRENGNTLFKEEEPVESDTVPQLSLTASVSMEEDAHPFIVEATGIAAQEQGIPNFNKLANQMQIADNEAGDEQHTYYSGVVNGVPIKEEHPQIDPASTKHNVGNIEIGMDASTNEGPRNDRGLELSQSQYEQMKAILDTVNKIESAEHNVQAAAASTQREESKADEAPSSTIEEMRRLVAEIETLDQEMDQLELKKNIKIAKKLVKAAHLKSLLREYQVSRVEDEPLAKRFKYNWHSLVDDCDEESTLGNIVAPDTDRQDDNKDILELLKQQSEKYPFLTEAKVKTKSMDQMKHFPPFSFLRNESHQNQKEMPSTSSRPSRDRGTPNANIHSIDIRLPKYSPDSNFPQHLSNLDDPRDHLFDRSNRMMTQQQNDSEDEVYVTRKSFLRNLQRSTGFEVPRRGLREHAQNLRNFGYGRHNKVSTQQFNDSDDDNSHRGAIEQKLTRDELVNLFKETIDRKLFSNEAERNMQQHQHQQQQRRRQLDSIEDNSIYLYKLPAHIWRQHRYETASTKRNLLNTRKPCTTTNAKDNEICFRVQTHDGSSDEIITVIEDDDADQANYIEIDVRSDENVNDNDNESSATVEHEEGVTTVKEDTQLAKPYKPTILSLCAFCKRPNPKAICMYCFNACYCSRLCQMKAWKKHIPTCKKLVKLNLKVPSP